MLTDDGLETLLRRYRVGNPTPGLEQAIVTTASQLRSPPPWSWIVGPAAAAATLVAWLGGHLVTMDRSEDPVRAAEVDRVADLLGGGDEARAYAEQVVPAPVFDEPGLVEEAQWPAR